MVQVIVATERTLADDIPRLEHRLSGREEAITQAAVEIGSATNASALVAFTQTGTTARRLCALRPRLPLLVFTPDPAVQSQLKVSWGVESFVAPTVGTTDEMIDAVNGAIRTLDRAQPGDTVVIVAGTPPGQPGNTNTIRVHEVD
jgi:pyruvate kinase